MICCTACGITVRALLLRGAAAAGKQNATLNKRTIPNCFINSLRLDSSDRRVLATGTAALDGQGTTRSTLGSLLLFAFRNSAKNYLPKSEAKMASEQHPFLKRTKLPLPF